MGNFSRDTFKLTNVMHQLITGEPVVDPRHYVGVRLQQGIPLLDSDLNELDDIRRMELRTILRYFIGEGVPANNQGFQISASGVDNNFTINPGLILVDGLPVINWKVTSYSDQPINEGLPALTTPPGGSDRTDVVYLNVWDEEVAGVGTGDVDSRLINEQIGIETALRIGRHWQVRVLENAEDLSGLIVEEGHSYAILAQLRRRAGVAAIRENMIVDLRKRGITLAENLKVPINLRHGLEVLDVQRFGQMLRGLRTTLFTRLRSNLLPYQTATPRDETLLLMALQELMNQAHIGEVQVFSRNLDNNDALRFMKDLYTAQDSWLGILSDIGNNGGIAQDFSDDYRDRLDGDPASLIKGLKPALDRDDLLAAVIAQEELNFWLTAPVGNLPEGQVDAIYLSVIPFETLTAGSSYDFTYDIVANFTSPLPEEDFIIQVTLPSGFGTAIVDQSLLTFSQPEGQATITVTVTPSGGTPSADLDVAAISVRNATLRSSQPSITLTLGVPPPVGTFFFYVGPRLNEDGRLDIPQNHLTRPQGRNISFRLRNQSVSETRIYRVTGQIVPEVPDTTGWSPLTPNALPDITLAPGGETEALIRVDGPKPPASAPPIDTIGDIIASATLIAIDGAPPADPQEPIVITIPFVVV